MDITAFIPGVLASLCAAVLWTFINTFVIPQIKLYRFKIPSIKGDWRLYRSGNPNNDDEGIFTIKQNGSRITGKHIDKDSGREFVYKGLFTAGQLVVTYEEKGGEGYIVGAMVFKLHPGFKEMEGRSLFWHNRDGQMECQEFMLKRP